MKTRYSIFYGTTAVLDGAAGVNVCRNACNTICKLLRISDLQIVFGGGKSLVLHNLDLIFLGRYCSDGADIVSARLFFFVPSRKAALGMFV